MLLPKFSFSFSLFCDNFDVKKEDLQVTNPLHFCQFLSVSQTPTNSTRHLDQPNPVTISTEFFSLTFSYKNKTKP